ncbi:hypothetical protein RHGRI_037299 [Rhododendron griersonianum]|uniref:Pectinesterase n=1 Tax=Rhododendron griersonianum TaxID=479676 RepID=A0AAV6HV96_9ERIC|nr:hypothetical protein RHGRI_037299 [Rhododendron griersonianum]
MVSEVASGNTMQMNSVDLLQMFLKKSTSHIRDAMEMASNISRRINDLKEQAAIADCLELMDLSVDRVMDSVLALGKRTARFHSDAHSWLSSVLTNHVTCLDGLYGPVRPMMKAKLNDLIARARASLAMVVAISPPSADELVQPLNGRFPQWVTSRDRKLLEAPAKNIAYNVLVAVDGSGNYKTVSAAVASAPNKGKTRYVIYVKAGTYKENVQIASGKTNLMLVGDGLGSTIITGSLNVVDGSTTFNSATVAAIIASITLVKTRLSNPKSYNPPLSAHVCDPALDRVSCWAMVSEVASGNTMQLKSVDLLQMFLEKSTSHIRDAMEMASSISHRINDPKEQAAIADCLELMDLSVDRVMGSILALGKQTARFHSDAHSWLSSVLTNHVTCLDGLNGPARPMMEPKLKDLMARARASLAMVVAVTPPPADEVVQPLNGKFPRWVTSRDRKLLEAPGRDIVSNVVVATDGSGNYTSVGDAVASAPNNGKTRYVIYVKAGTYNETVRIAKGKTNLMLVGDGMNLTIITGSLNVVDGSTTFNSATVGSVCNLFWYCCSLNVLLLCVMLSFPLCNEINRMFCYGGANGLSSLWFSVFLFWLLRHKLIGSFASADTSC